ncbi:MAG: alpha-mannosidase [Prevotella sp.]|nr:alpha-mannosidase [Prevotella sp.]
MIRKTVLAIALATISLSSAAQERNKSYFADGFHGGVYGHYPLAWYTQFMIDQLDQNPQWRIGLELEPETWDSVKVHTPEAYARWQQVVVGEQVEYTNPGYAQSYLYPVLGESIIRQFQYGMRKLHQHFPTMTFTTYSTEEPCFTSCLPQILHQLGFRHAVLKCPDTCWGGYTEAFGGELVNWIGPDGTSLVSVPRYECEALEENSVWQTKAWKNNRDYLQACKRAGIQHPVGMCYQDAGWKYGPWLGKNHRSEYVRWTDYIETIADPSSATDYRMPQEDVRVALVWGSQVMQRIGRQVRHAENTILEAERLSSMRYVIDGTKPDQTSLDEAWRTLLLAQHHDSWIVPYNRLNKQGTWADNIAIWTDQTCQRAGKTIAEATASTETSGRQTYYNTTGKARKEIVTGRRSDGTVIDFQVTLPAFGYVTVDADSLQLPASKPHIKVKKEQATLENNQYRLVFDLKRGGILTSLYDKSQAKELVDAKSNYGFGELRGYFESYRRFCSSTEKPATAEVVKDNNFVQSLCISGEIAGVGFSQTYTLLKDQPQIDVDLLIDWKHNTRIGNHYKRQKGDKSAPFYNTKYMLNVLFPANLKDPKLWKNAPYDVCESRLDSTFFDRWTDIRHNIIHSWIDIAETSVNKKNAGGLALLSDHTTSYSFAKDYPLALTVQYSGTGLWGRDHRITTKTQLRYALVPHRGMWDEAGISDINENWNRTTMPQQTQPEKQQNLMDIGSKGLQISSLTIDDQGDLLLRLFNADGDEQPQNITLNFPVQSVEEVDLRGNTQQKLTMDGPLLTVQMPRFGLRTYRIRPATHGNPTRQNH